MSYRNVDSLCIRAHISIRDAMTQLDRGGLRVLFLCDTSGRLCRTVTDGDLRRLLVGGAALEDTLVLLDDKPSVCLPLNGNIDAARVLMDEHQVDHIPLVDEEARPRDLIIRSDLHGPILLSTPHLGDQERVFVEEAFRSNWIAPLGPNVDAFERELADYVGVGHAAAVSSGTAAIHLALILLGVGPGDRVFCSSLTFVASANPILYLGALPVFIDSDPATWNLSVPALRRAFEDASNQGQLPRALVVVNLYGQSADMVPILELCRAHEVAVVEDAAESLGATYQDRASGTWGDIGIYSFNGNKIITTSGGGMMVSRDGELMARARFLATQAREPAPWYLHTQMGFNYRMSNILAGVGRGQLRVLDDRVAARRRIFAHYQDRLGDLPGLSWMPEAPFGRSTRWLSVCTFDPALVLISTPDFIAALARRNIEARHVWNPMHRQPLFAQHPYYPHAEDHSFSDAAFRHGVCLPSGSNLKPAQIDFVCDAIRDTLSSATP